MTPLAATEHLFYSPKRGSKVLYKVIRSAMANAKATLKTDDHLLQFKALFVDEGNTLKRFRAGSKGGAKPIAREFSHITVILEAVSLPTPKKEEPKKLEEGKKETKTVTSKKKI